MCRNIKTLHHFEPPATEEEVRASALQYVRKLTGMNSPSQVNQKAFNAAVEDITALTLSYSTRSRFTVRRGRVRSRSSRRLSGAESAKSRCV